MTTGTAIAIGVGVVGVGAALVIWQKKRNAALFPGGVAPMMPPRSPLADVYSYFAPTPAPNSADLAPPIVTLPALPAPPPPPPLPLGVSPGVPAGIGVIVAAAAPMIGSPPAPPPPPPPPIPVATSVGTLYFPPTVTQQQAQAKVSDLAAIYAVTSLPPGFIQDN